MVSVKSVCTPVCNYYEPRFGRENPGLVVFYLLAGLALFVLVVAFSFQEANKFKDGSNTTDFFLVDDPRKHFHAVAILTIITFLLTATDFILMNKNWIRITPLTIATGVLATFLGLALWTLSTNKDYTENHSLIVIFQACANAVQLAAIFNGSDKNLITNSGALERFL